MDCPYTGIRVSDCGKRVGGIKRRGETEELVGRLRETSDPGRDPEMRAYTNTVPNAAPRELQSSSFWSCKEEEDI